MKIFVSSTTKDLGDAREKVCKQIAGLDNQYVCMDCYTASGRPPAEFDDTKVKECDAFVVIVAHYYGSCPPGKDKSFTELEYEAAIASGKPIYPFLASEAFPASQSLREDDATHAKLQAFRDRLGRDHTPKPFDSVDDLRAAVATAIPKPTEQAGRISVPKLPQAYLAHPYALQENFTGRIKERAMLTEWVSAEDSRPMLSLVGMGGLGKSALTWYWLREDLPQEGLGFSGVIWWSFYEREASFDGFLRHGLLYASGGTIDPAQLPSDYDRMQSLWCILHNSPFLVVFDGAERLLRAYHALDAPYRGDDLAEESDGRHLLCADPRAGQFLQALADPWAKTRTLLTTRLHPKELEELAGCQREDLKHLEPDDAVGFMRRQGVKGPRNAIVHACEPYDFLPLCIRLLSGAIRRDPEKPGDIAVAENWRPPMNLVRREHHILQIAYDTMAKDRRDLLSCIAAMRGPVNYDTVKVLSTHDDENRLKEALCELVVRGLLFRREGQVDYDLHPIVRQYAYDRLGDKGATHKALRDYFDTVPQPYKIETLDDLMPTIELFHHTIRAGAYEQASRIYQDRLANALYFQLGAYDVDISLKEAFCPGGIHTAPRLKARADQAWLLNGLAASYNRTGQSRKAVRLFERSNAIYEDRGPRRSHALCLGNLAVGQLLLGSLKAAESHLRRAISINGEIGEKWDEAVGHQELGRLLTYAGRYDHAVKELRTALRVFIKQDHDQGQCVVWSYRGLGMLLMNKPKSALGALREARLYWKLVCQRLYPVERDGIRILWLLGAARRRMGRLVGAETFLDRALSRCRRVRLVEFEADILLEMAKLQWQKAAAKHDKLVQQAKSLSGEALEIADRCEYRFQQADIHNFLARMALGESDRVTARQHAEIAKERAWCDGPPHCYRKALDEAEEMLAKLQ